MPNEVEREIEGIITRHRQKVHHAEEMHEKKFITIPDHYKIMEEADTEALTAIMAVVNKEKESAYNKALDDHRILHGKEADDFLAGLDIKDREEKKE